VSKRQKQRTNQNRERRLGSGEGIARPKGGSGSGIPLWMWALSLSGFVALGVVVAVLLLTRGGSSANADPAVITERNSTDTIDFIAQGTWPPNYDNLSGAISALGLPGLSDTVEHYHVHIRLMVNDGGESKSVPIPEDIGLDRSTQTYAAIHTHDATGVIHIEADQKGYRSDLQNVFDIWGVRFNAECIGGYCGGVKMWVNGTPNTQLGAYVLQPHDAITIVEGTPPPGFKPDTSYKFPAGE
jgi:hypothetical protein